MPATTSVFLNVTQIAKSLEFYRALGFRVLKEYKDKAGSTTYADLAFQGAELGLGHIPSNDDPAFRAWVGTPLGAGVVTNFSVPDVDKVHAAAKAIKADIEMPPTDRPYGRMLTVNDPDGYTLSFLTEPRARKASAKKAKRAAPTRAKTKSAKAKAARRTRR